MKKSLLHNVLSQHGLVIIPTMKIGLNHAGLNVAEKMENVQFAILMAMKVSVVEVAPSIPMEIVQIKQS